MISDEERAIRQRLKDDFAHYASKCLRIRTKNGAIVPFVLNRAQCYAHAQIEAQRGATGRVRAITLKGRQCGFSTYTEGRYYWRTTHAMGYRAFILTHDGDATQNLYEMVHRYHENCPELVRPSTGVSNSRELVFDKLDSGYKIGTAGNKGVGRSSTIQLFHGCLGENTLVYDAAKGGVKKIQDFMIGDFVLTHNSNIAPISFISSQQKECFSIKLRTHTSFPINATFEHRFWTKSGWKEIGEMQVGDCIGYPIKKITPKIDHLDLPCAKKRIQGGGRQGTYNNRVDLTYDFGLLVGLYLAEGYIKVNKEGNPAGIIFAVHRREADRTISWVSKFSDYYSKIIIVNRKDSLTSEVIIYGNRFSALIEQTCGRTINKHAPLNWHNMPVEFCRGLLHGYLAGDGHSDINSRRINAPSIRSEITIPIRDITASLEYGWASIKYREGAVRNGRNEKTQYTFSLCGDGATKLAKEIGFNFSERKKKKTLSVKKFAASSVEISDGYAWLRINSIDKVGIKNVYDFEIDHDDHSYCIVNAATHNSEVAFWPNADEHAKGILQCVPNTPGTEIIFESTANGVGGYFHEQWQLAEAGLSDFIPIFTPWFWQDEYSREIIEPLTLTDEEEEIKTLYNLSDAQLLWRRYKIVELSVGGIDGSKSFAQEYPNNPIEAFQTTAEDVFISPATVMTARKCEVEAVGPLLIGVDPARFGDDRTAIIRRRTRCAYKIETYLKKSTMEIAGVVHNIIINETPDKVFVDVVGLGAGVYDRLVELGHKQILVAVNAGNSPLDANKYLNKRAEMWGTMHEWLQSQPASIPDDDALHADLCGPKYSFDSNGRLVIEKKEQMKKRGLRSPDAGDALSLTFYLPVSAYVRNVQKDQVAAKMMSKYRRINHLKDQCYGNR